MDARPFRFGVVAAPTGSGDQWIATARRVEELGFDTLLCPDGLQLLASGPALAAAATATARLRVGQYVLAGPLRPARAAAWEGHSLSVLTGGRFEFGIGTGRPAARAQVEQLGLPWGTGAERLAAVERAVADLRELDSDRHTPVLIAAGGPRALKLAARIADTVALAAPPLAADDDYARLADQVRVAAGPRAEEVELATNLLVVGDEVPPSTTWCPSSSAAATSWASPTSASAPASWTGSPPSSPDSPAVEPSACGAVISAFGTAVPRCRPSCPVGDDHVEHDHGQRDISDVRRSPTSRTGRSSIVTGTTQAVASGARSRWCSVGTGCLRTNASRAAAKPSRSSKMSRAMSASSAVR